MPEHNVDYVINYMRQMDIKAIETEIYLAARRLIELKKLKKAMEIYKEDCTFSFTQLTEIENECSDPNKYAQDGGPH